MTGILALEFSGPPLAFPRKVSRIAMITKQPGLALPSMIRATLFALTIAALPHLALAEGTAPQAKVAKSATRSTDLESLLDMLSLVPKNLDHHFELPVAVYMDYRAAEKAGRITNPGGRSALVGLNDQAFDKWSLAMTRLTGDPRLENTKIDPSLKADPLDLANEIHWEKVARSVPGVTSVFRTLPDTLGIEWFAVDRVIRFGHPLTPAVALSSGRDLTANEPLEKALRAHGFAPQKMGGAVVWHRFDDDDVQPEAMAPADALAHRATDFFGIGHGRAARIVVLENVLVGSPTWAQTEAIIETARASASSIGDASSFQAAARGITDPETFKGALVQALFFDRLFEPELMSVRKLGPYSSQQERAELIKSWKERPSLPPYQLAVLADRQTGEEEVALIGLVYADRDLAKTAATVLSARLTSYESVRLRQRPAEYFSAKVESHVYFAEDIGHSVALVKLRYTPSSDRQPDVRRARLFQVLQNDLYWENLDALIVDPSFILRSSDSHRYQEPAFVIINRLEPAYTVFSSWPKGMPEQETRELETEIKAQHYAVMVTWADFVKSVDMYVKSTILKQEYPQYTPAKVITCLLANSGPLTFWGLAWNGGIVTEYDQSYKHAEWIFKSYQEDPEAYNAKTDRDLSPLDPGRFLRRAGCG